MVRRASAMSVSPSNPTTPMPPAYGPRRVGSNSSMICMARSFGAPVTVPTGRVARSASQQVRSRGSRPVTVELRCITWL